MPANSATTLTPSRLALEVALQNLPGRHPNELIKLVRGRRFPDPSIHSRDKDFRIAILDVDHGERQRLRPRGSDPEILNRRGAAGEIQRVDPVVHADGEELHVAVLVIANRDLLNLAR